MFKIIPISPIVRQFIFAIIANFTYLHIGLSAAWISPVISKLRDGNQTVFPQPITDSEAAWITSISFLTGGFALFLASYISNKLGRKISLLIVIVPRVVMCFLSIFASRPWMLILARMLSGLADTAISLATTYTSEIANKETRGAMGSISPVMSGLGVMIMLSFGPYTTYVMLQVVYTCIIVVTCLPLVFLPESPYYLYSKGREQDCIKILTQLRGSSTLAQKEYLDYSQIKNMEVNRKEVFCDKIVLKTLLKAVILGFGSQAIGYNILMLYLQTIYEMTHTNISPAVSSAVSGCIQLIASVCTILLADKFGRKPLLISSLIGFCIGTVGLGVFFKLTENKNEIMGVLNYLPLMSIILIIFCNNFGIGSLIYTVIAELFDGPARAHGVALGVFTATIFTFLGSWYFYVITNAIGLAGTSWVFSGFCVLTTLFVWLCLPETKGKPFLQIQMELGRIGVKENFS